MKKPLRILSVIDIPWNSGLAAYAFAQALALRACGHAVVFACPDGSAAMAFARRENFAVHSIPGRKQYHRLPLALLRLRAIVKDSAIDAVCAHTGRAQTLACLLGVPVLRVKADARKPSIGFTFDCVAKVIAASDYIKDLYLAAGLAADKVVVIRQGIELPPAALRAPVPPYKVGLLGRLDPVKGHACFLKAAARLLASGVKAEFHIAGYEANIKYSELETLAAALEWLAAGKPLVATLAGSLPEYAGPERLALPGDPEDLARKMGALLADPAAMAAQGEVNRAKAARDFSPAAFGAATCSVIEDALF